MSTEAMDTNDTEGEPSGRPGRGRPPRISREQIVSAARSVPRQDFSMKAVADAMGVSRKALHYHVSDREGLLNLMVIDHFESELGGAELPSDGDWQSTLRAYAHAYHRGIVQVGVTATHIQIHGIGGSASMALAEHVLQSLLTAGFDDRLARRALTTISNLAMTAGHNELLRQQGGVTPQEAEVADALAHAPEDQFPALRRIVANAHAEGPGVDEQFNFELDLAIAGLVQLLAAHPSRP
ncbi:TetR/AcrR family transcriptional regulator C-terminal domain-containing protein [Aldersonia sp. NBC_00410]|uniref:TetR/AcrR family transcriptional regulator n=1 Tax=Aldersonia sp. NBC_00410 TaxID=2975954 RepID=UPI00225B54BA|nr:TetR/AcrR family transcriptional regulator C-terminal domain-containing protein [Aldersonia sp. NBC_00410]MCX5042349.1 TetR/AcrR family transcriptional regulator C-terminal domain-containing protein [Aldersonia sp. NBC_00410]